MHRSLPLKDYETFSCDNRRDCAANCSGVFRRFVTVLQTKALNKSALYIDCRCTTQYRQTALRDVNATIADCGGVGNEQEEKRICAIFSQCLVWHQNQFGRVIPRFESLYSRDSNEL